MADDDAPARRRSRGGTAVARRSPPRRMLAPVPAPPDAVIGLVLVVAFLMLAVFGPAADRRPDGCRTTRRPWRRPRAATCSAPTTSAATRSPGSPSGARVSLQAGVLSTLLAMVVGIPIGLVGRLLPRLAGLGASCGWSTCCWPSRS